MPKVRKTLACVFFSGRFIVLAPRCSCANLGCVTEGGVAPLFPVHCPACPSTVFAKHFPLPAHEPWRPRDCTGTWAPLQVLLCPSHPSTGLFASHPETRLQRLYSKSWNHTGSVQFFPFLPKFEAILDFPHFCAAQRVYKKAVGILIGFAQNLYRSGEVAPSRDWVFQPQTRSSSPRHPWGGLAPFC